MGAVVLYGKGHLGTIFRKVGTVHGTSVGRIGEEREGVLRRNSLPYYRNNYIMQTPGILVDGEEQYLAAMVDVTRICSSHCRQVLLISNTNFVTEDKANSHQSFTVRNTPRIGTTTPPE